MDEIDQRLQIEIEYAGIPVSFTLPSKDDHISKLLMAERNFYEIHMLEALAPALKEGDLVIDAGANIGNHTLFFAKILQCRVLAFEAVPSTAALLVENVNANGLATRVQVHQVALGERSGAAKVVAYDESNVGGTTLKAAKHGSIPILPLDKVRIDGRVRLLKIDVEGMDLAVLKGAKHILEKDRPWVVCEAGTDVSSQPIHEFMDLMGYTPTAVYNATDTYLFLPSRSDEERRLLVDRAFAQMMAMQRDEKRIAARLAQAGRYSERMKREALAEVQERLEGWDKRQAELEQELNMHTAARESRLPARPSDFEKVQAVLQQELLVAQARGMQAELEQQLSLRKLAASERQHEAKAAELADARAALQAEQRLTATQVADAQRRAGEDRKEIAVLLERAAQTRQVLEQQRASLASLAATLARERAEHERRMTDLRASSQRAGEAAKAQADQLSKRLAERDGLLAKRDGLLVRKERELADRQRRVADAHRVLRIRTHRVAELEQDLTATNDELARLRASISFKLGGLVVSSMRSPLRAVALLWNIPALLWRGWRRQGSGNKSQGSNS